MKKLIIPLAMAALVGVGAAGAFAAADPTVKITRVNYNAVGADTLANRWQEAVYLRNTTAGELDISGWTVHDAYTDVDGDHTNAYTFPAATKVKAGGLVVVSPAAGVNKTDPGHALIFYMDFKRGHNGHFLGNGGDTVTVEDADGTVVTSFAYDFDNGFYVR